MSIFRRRQVDPWEPQQRFNGLSFADFNSLANYNAERGRGVMHTPEWQEKMAALQSQFDAAEREHHRQWLSATGRIDGTARLGSTRATVRS